MEGKKHIQKFNEHQENLNISDVSCRSKFIKEFLNWFKDSDFMIKFSLDRISIDDLYNEYINDN